MSMRNTQCALLESVIGAVRFQQNSNLRIGKKSWPVAYP
ncbi:hypothetical protein M2103_001046 [Ereboglobus sp. PH5-5]|nr:hypothetical protein [Ereboglobus sp. PH5-5]